MRKLRISVLSSFLLGITLTIISCGNTSAHSESAQDEVSTTIDKAETIHAIKEYLKLKDALVEGDNETALAAARELSKVFEKSQDQLALKIRVDAEHIAETTDIDLQRKYFNALSSNIYTLVKLTGVDRKLYKQYCPMAMDNKGAYWLSAESEVNNPYFGDLMLHCGVVKEEL